MRRGAALAWVIAAALAAGGCASTTRHHGYVPQPEDLASVVVGQDTRASVRTKLGQPGATGLFQDDGWYYVSTQIEQKTYNAPKIIDRKVVAVLFDGNDTVASVDTYGLENGRVINLQTRTTPTFGRELTVLQQLFGNIGAIDPSVFNNEPVLEN